MEEFKGTKGSWIVENKGSNGLVNKYQAYSINTGNEDNWAIAAVWKDSDGDCLANAQLIAAAPDLLEALQELTKWSAHIPDLTNQDLEKAQQAINKALGK